MYAVCTNKTLLIGYKVTLKNKRYLNFGSLVALMYFHFDQARVKFPLIPVFFSTKFSVTFSSDPQVSVQTQQPPPYLVSTGSYGIVPQRGLQLSLRGPRATASTTQRTHTPAFIGRTRRGFGTQTTHLWCPVRCLEGTQPLAVLPHREDWCLGFLVSIHVQTLDKG